MANVLGETNMDPTRKEVVFLGESYILIITAQVERKVLSEKYR